MQTVLGIEIVQNIYNSDTKTKFQRKIEQQYRRIISTLVPLEINVDEDVFEDFYLFPSFF